MWRVLVLLAVGCGFQHGTAASPVSDGPGDAVVDTLDAPADASIDAPGPLNIAYEQGSGAVTSMKTVPIAYPNAQLNHDLNVVFICWINNDDVSSVQDGTGNTYQVAIGKTTRNGMNFAAYYACGVAATPTNIVTVTFQATPSQSDIRIVEYSGIKATGCFDQAATNNANTVAETVGPVSSPGRELLLAGNCTYGTTTAADPTFTSRGIDGFGDIVEDRVVTTAGPYTAAATQNSINDWVLDVLTFGGN